MGPGSPSAGRWNHLVCVLAALLFALPVSEALAQAPGGFVEKQTDTAVRPLWTAAQIQAFLPQRGKFTFPAPYNTEGIRLTNASDCTGGSDCVNYIGYSYWRNMNNHVGSDTMLVVVSLGGNNGGPTLFSYNKVTDQVTKVGSLFTPNDDEYWSTAEGWYFSATQPTKLYVSAKGPQLQRFDVITKTMTTVFDITAQLGSGKYVWQTHSSNDDKVHSATVKQSSSGTSLGCVAYKEDTQQFFYYPVTSEFDECQLDKSGRYLLIKDNTDGHAATDNRFIDLQTGTERFLSDENGAGGHSDNGFGYMVAADNWNGLPGVLRVWKFDGSSPQGLLAYRTTAWNMEIGHVSHTNATTGPLSQQYGCGGGATRSVGPRANELVCFRLDNSGDVLVVTQLMTNLNASGGANDYGKDAKGNLDVTGKYFIWTSNMGGSRLDAFIAKVPSQLLVSTTPDTTPPLVSIFDPTPGATVAGSVPVSADATDNISVVGVQFKLDGQNLGSEVTAPPYTTTWDTGTATNGTHSLTAVARDAGGNSTVSGAVSVTVNNTADTTPPVISGVSATNITTTGATITWTTNEPADSRVNYGVTTSYGTNTPLDGTMVVSHSQTLTGLTQATLHHYRVRSRDAAGLLTISGDFTFTTQIAGGPGPLIARLEFEEGTGTTTADLSGNGNAGTLVTGATWGDGSAGLGATLDGSAGYVRIAHTSLLDAYPLTVAAWFKTTTTSGVAALVNKYVPSSANGYQVFFEDGKICAWYQRDASNRVFDGTGCTLATTGYNDGQWHQAVFTVDASGGKLFLDGVQKATQAWTGTAGVCTTTQEIRVGNYPGAEGGGFLPASVDDVRVYNQALSSAAVLQLYNDTVPTDTTPPVISGIGVSGIGSSSATIAWTTDEAADSQVNYGLTTAYGSSTTLNTSLVLPHSQGLTGLTGGTLYHYRVRSRDAAGNLTVSGDATFTTTSSMPLICPAAPVGPGATFNSTVNGGSSAMDWVATYTVGAPNNSAWLGTFQYVSLPRPATRSMIAPATGGTYELRLFANNAFTLIGSCTYQVTGATPSLSINDVTVTEGNTGTVNVAFTVTLSAAATGAVTVQFGTANGTATAGTDYVANSGTLTFNAGETVKTVVVAVNGDTTVEADETLFVNLSAPAGATISDGQGQATITNDDSSGAALTCPASVAPGASFNAMVTGGTSVKDWLASSVPGSPNNTWLGTFKYAPLPRPATVSMTAPASNGTYELRLFANDTFTLIGSCTYQVGAGPTPSLAINDVTVTEGNSGTVNATFNVTLSAAASGTVTVGFATADGTAAAGTDYVASSGTLTFTAGQTVKTVTVAVNGDTTAEANETFFVNLSAPSGATLSDSQGQGTITNDDSSASPLTCPTSVAPGASFNTTVTGGSTVKDWLASYVPGSPNTAWLGQFKYVPLPRPATVSMTAPASGGTYELRLFANDAFTLIGSCTYQVTP